MSSSQSAQSNPDEPIDAIVYDVHPALAAAADYPYAARPAPADPSFVARPQDIYKPPPVFSFTPPAPAQYMVPQRFGMSAILGIMTALAILFGAFRFLNVPPLLYLFFGLQAIVICIAQMLYGRTPRVASAVAGAVILPVFMLLTAAYLDDSPDMGLFCLLFFSVPAGAFLGYVTGTMAAGVFLVMDYAEQYFHGHRTLTPTPEP
jgi:hypothetical protein